MDFAPQLEFDGACEAAFTRYAELFGGRINMMNKLGDSEDVALPPGSRGGAPEMVRFAELQLGQSKIRGNDLPSDDYHPPRGFNLSAHFETVAEARRVFDGLAEGGKVTVEPAKVDWAELFGMVTDRFGIPWLILGLKS